MGRSDRKTVVVTGVSSGLGYAIVEFLVAKHCHVFGSVRKKADADRLKADFGECFTPMIFDVLDEAAVKKTVVEVGSHTVWTTSKQQQRFANCPLLPSKVFLAGSKSFEREHPQWPRK